MASVTQRIKMITQPRGGYLNPKSFDEISLPIKQELKNDENIHPSLVGLAVDYLTRFALGSSPKEAFHISLLGASNLGDHKQANAILLGIKGLDDTSIVSACKMVGYDVAFRSGPMGYRPVSEINPDSETIENIRIMVNRSLDFFRSYGPIVLDGFTFEGAYSKLINTGDGDFVTSDTLWDFKVSVSPPTKEHTLQLLIYYLMGKKSIHSVIFKALSFLGVYNPRLNVNGSMELLESGGEKCRFRTIPFFDIIESKRTGGYQHEKRHQGGHELDEERGDQAQLCKAGENVWLRLSNGETVL